MNIRTHTPAKPDVIMKTKIQVCGTDILLPIRDAAEQLPNVAGNKVMFVRAELHRCAAEAVQAGNSTRCTLSNGMEVIVHLGE